MGPPQHLGRSGDGLSAIFRQCYPNGETPPVSGRQDGASSSPQGGDREEGRSLSGRNQVYPQCCMCRGHQVGRRIMGVEVGNDQEAINDGRGQTIRMQGERPATLLACPVRGDVTGRHQVQSTGRWQARDAPSATTGPRAPGGIAGPEGMAVRITAPRAKPMVVYRPARRMAYPPSVIMRLSRGGAGRRRIGPSRNSQEVDDREQPDQ